MVIIELYTHNLVNKVVSDYIIYFYIIFLVYIRHNADVSLEKRVRIFRYYGMLHSLDW
jgi:hypothetical protein